MAALAVAPAEPQSAPIPRPGTGKFLIFQLGAEEFGISVRKVREIIQIQPCAAVPNAPPHIRGVINLRGAVVAIVDLRRKFVLPPHDDDARTCIVVVEIDQPHGSVRVGIIVDGVVEVQMVGDNEIAQTPDFGAGAATPFLLGMAKTKDRIRMLLDIDQVLGNREWKSLEQALGKRSL